MQKSKSIAVDFTYAKVVKYQEKRQNGMMHKVKICSLIVAKKGIKNGYYFK